MRCLTFVNVNEFTCTYTSENSRRTTHTIHTAGTHNAIIEQKLHVRLQAKCTDNNGNDDDDDADDDTMSTILVAMVMCSWPQCVPDEQHLLMKMHLSVAKTPAWRLDTIFLAGEANVER